MHLNRSRMIWVLLGAVLVLLIVAAVAWSLSIILRREPEPAPDWQDPIAAVNPEGVAPDLALYPLAGASAAETIDASIASGELETAYSLLVYSQELSDSQRIGRLGLLGSRYAESGLAEQAELCFQQVFDEAVLGPRLSEAIRADAFLAAGDGLVTLEDEGKAKQSYAQAFLVATHGSHLPKAHRRELLVRLEVAYRGLEDLEQAEDCLAEIEKLDREPGNYSPAASDEPPALPAGEEPISSPEVGAAEEARRQAAFELLQAVGSGEGEPPADLVSRLAQALLEEDALKLSLYQSEMELTTQPGRRSDIQVHVLRWLLVKYQVANRGFGLVLVPEWEAQVEEIRAALSQAFEDLSVEYEDFVAALPKASQMEPLRYEALRRQILAGRRGQYPEFPVERLAQGLITAVNAVMHSTPGEGLFVEPAWTSDGLEFSLSPATGYGGEATETP